jgi:carbon storage regulator
MLIFSRRRGECIRIDDRITIKVLAIRPGHVNVGINAPRSVQVDREEVYQRKRLNGRARQTR